MERGTPRLMPLLPGMTRPLKIRRVGNSCGVILPKDLLDGLGLREGSTVTITRTPDGLLLTPVHTDSPPKARVSAT